MRRGRACQFQDDQASTRSGRGNSTNGHFDPGFEVDGTPPALQGRSRWAWMRWATLALKFSKKSE
jgi:hypothetical protein